MSLIKTLKVIFFNPRRTCGSSKLVAILHEYVVASSLRQGLPTHRQNTFLWRKSRRTLCTVHNYIMESGEICLIKAWYAKLKKPTIIQIVIWKGGKTCKWIVISIWVCKGGKIYYDLWWNFKAKHQDASCIAISFDFNTSRCKMHNCHLHIIVTAIYKTKAWF